MAFKFPDDFLFADSHEYAHVEDIGVRIGISAFAVDQLGDIVFVDLPEVGTEIEKGMSFGSVESVKAVEDMNAPLTGKVLEINEAVLNNPEDLQNDPHGKGWLLVVSLASEEQLKELMTSDIYAKKIAVE